MPKTPSRITEINKSGGAMQSFVSARSLRSFSSRRQSATQKLGSAAGDTMAQIRAQRRLMMQQISQEVLNERKKEAYKIAKMSIINVEEENIIHEHDGADEDHSSVNTSRKDSQVEGDLRGGVQIEVVDLENSQQFDDPKDQIIEEQSPNIIMEEVEEAEPWEKPQLIHNAQTKDTQASEGDAALSLGDY